MCDRPDRLQAIFQCEIDLSSAHSCTTGPPAHIARTGQYPVRASFLLQFLVSLYQASQDKVLDLETTSPSRAEFREGRWGRWW